MKKIYLLALLTIVSVNLFSQTEWVKHEDNPVMTAGPDAWELPKALPGSVIYYEGMYHMWFSGGDFPAKGGDFLIGHAASPDGIVWTKDFNNPVLDKGMGGEWDDNGVFDPSVIMMDTIFHMWYNGYTDDKDYHSIGHANSPDGVSWTKDPENPVLSPGAGGIWDYNENAYPTVVFDGSGYHMWYAGGEFLAWNIGYATSQDGSVWTKFEENPVLSKGLWDSFESNLVSISAVMIDDSGYKMWYRGQKPDGSGGIGYATSESGPTGIIENGITDQIRIFPNPASDLLNIRMDFAGASTLEISTINGHLIQTRHLTGNLHEIDITPFEEGDLFPDYKNGRSDNHPKGDQVLMRI